MVVPDVTPVGSESSGRALPRTEGALRTSRAGVRGRGTGAEALGLGVGLGVRDWAEGREPGLRGVGPSLGP